MNERFRVMFLRLRDSETCPSGNKLVENCGIVTVDEVDLHLHPRWQMTVLQTPATGLPAPG